MFCANCGTQLDDDALFCHGCGARTNVQEAAPVNTPEEGSGKTSGKGSGKTSRKFPKKLISILAVIVALALVVTAVSTIFVGPSGKLLKALAKSGNEFLSAAESAGLTNLGSIATMKDVSMDYDFWLDKLDGSSELEGMGVRGFLDTSLSNEKIAISATPYFGSADLVTLNVKLDGEKLYAGSPELTKDVFYMINTKTIGADAEKLFGAAGVEDLGFNLFELIKSIEKIASDNADVQKAVSKALRSFLKEIEVEKDGTETMEVNDQDLKCTAYHVTVTEDSMEALLDALKDIYGGIDNTDQYVDILKSVGLPDEAIDEFESALETSEEETDAVFDTLDDAIGELGDVELDMYVNKGYVVAAIYELDFDGESMEVILNVGGGKNYIDDISLRLEVDDSVLSISASGNHTGKGGEFTSEMKVKADKQTLADVELSYAPKAKSDNFSFELSAPGGKLSAEGQVSIDKNALAVRMEKVKIASELTFGFDYQLSKYSGDRVKTGKSESLFEMSQDELAEAFTEIGENATELLEDLISEIPALQYLF